MNSYDIQSDLTVDPKVLPFVRKMANEGKKGRARSGSIWTTVEDATVLLALSENILEGEGTIIEKVTRFLQQRPGWDISKTKPETFLAKMYRRRRQGPI